ncbi:MAG: hypothetical protein A2Z14_04415 [Chloroflexi bacterium RBG_16_48_8]|nr:MAG: hypothetical protein A2Z14_04415 [Chloroflexi bacterium RBG_16_48_8]
MSSQFVECYSGQTYAERPLALYWEGERLEITKILSRWRSPGDIHFLVLIGDGRTFELAYKETEDLWSIELR